VPLGGSAMVCDIRGMPTDPDIAALAGLIDRARRAVVFTGAGISTESGIPDFRSPGGIWTRMAPIDFAEFLASEEARRETWRRRFAMEETFRAAAPNRGHRAVAELVRRGTVAVVVTQNIDGLHQASGVPAGQVVELHGNTTWAHCLDCARRYELDAVRAAFERDETPPRCDDCGGFVKTATVSFGQAMPIAAMRRAETETLAADLFIVAGSSLVVYPAAGFPELAKRNRAALVIVNREATALDPIADLVLNRTIGETLGAAVGVD
jgi:NAD-dependent deacetylase